MLNRTSRYALATLGHLVRTRGGKVSAETIATETGIPANYLSKILNRLRKHGFVTSERGWGGGFELVQGAMQRPVRDVLVILDGTTGVEDRECVFGLPACDPADPCPLHPQWERIKEAYLAMITETRVADLGSAPPELG